MVKKNYKPRIMLIFIVFLLLYLVIFIRLYILQIHGKKYFKNLAKQQYELQLKTNPNRGKIYDNTGKNVLAFNIQDHSAFVLPKQFKNKKQILSFLKKNYKKSYDQIIKNQYKKFVWLERHLTENKLQKLKNLNMEDIHFLNEPSRFYSLKSAANVIGFTNTDNVGLEGIELEFNNYLKGKPAIFNLKKDARKDSFYFDKKILKKGQKGNEVTLTLNSKLQFLAQEELKKTIKQFEAKQGSVLIMNPHNGEILAMTNYPNINSNKKTNTKKFQNIKNIVVTECFELGSVIKTFSALAALEEEVVSPDEIIDCQGKYAYIDKFRVENWKSVGEIPFSDVIRYSSNVGIAKVVQRLGPKFYEHLKRLGFGSKTGIQFPGERSGFVNPPDNWSRSSLIVMSFGYEINATILQLGKAFSIIANGGFQVDPVLIKKPAKNKSKFTKKIYKFETIKQIKNILETIGNRYSKNIKDFRVMGKTGTARSIENGKYTNKKHVYSFGGIIEKGDYKRVIITFIKEPKKAGWWASQITAPLFINVAEKVIINDKLNGYVS